MILTVTHANRVAERQALRAMFEARKQVFVDLLKWDVPVIAGRYELDQFDDVHATYLIVTDPARRHLASARLLDTRRPTLLDTVFGGLCDRPPPRGEDVREITRFCLSRGIGSSLRRTARDRLVTALALHALDSGIGCYTGVAEPGWYRQIFGFGWDCRPLGPFRRAGAQTLGAFAIAIDQDTPRRLQRAGVLQTDMLSGAQAA
ncbi:MAG TPA: acyl-homoserine-lactone synthase [Reyranella sp.]|nr:acyl-homoserine-lactone synthase [Reyranella sp.]